VFGIAPPVNRNEEDKEVGVEEEGLEPCPRVEHPLPPTIFGPAPGEISDFSRGDRGAHWTKENDPAQATRNLDAGLSAPGERPRGGPKRD
jgi:hypothetical protein